MAGMRVYLGSDHAGYELKQHLLEHLTWLGVLQTATLWFAVWLGWQYTCWMTNWFDPGALPRHTGLPV